MSQSADIAIVPIRAGSKGLAGKNIRPLAGLPLYLHAVYQGLRTASEVVLTTDIAEELLAEVPAGCRLLRRPSDLALDDTAMAPVMSHAIETCGLVDRRIVLLQATSPLRSDEDVTATMALHAKGSYDLALTVTEADASVLKHGTIEGEAFKPMRDPNYCFSNRQSLPPVYRPNGAVYVFEAQRFVEMGAFPSERIGAYRMPQSRSLDIDSEEDFQVAEAALTAEHDRAKT